MENKINEKIIVCLVVAGGVISVLFAILINWDLNSIILFKNEEIKQMTLQLGSEEENGKIRYNIENYELIEDEYIINGWLHKINENMMYINNRVVLYDIQSDIFIGLITQKIDRPDIEEVYGSNYQYRNGGFYSAINLDKLLPDHTYEICLLYKSEPIIGAQTNNILVMTGDLISK